MLEDSLERLNRIGDHRDVADALHRLELCEKETFKCKSRHTSPMRFSRTLTRQLAPVRLFTVCNIFDAVSGILRDVLGRLADVLGGVGSVLGRLRVVRSHDVPVRVLSVEFGDGHVDSFGRGFAGAVSGHREREELEGGVWDPRLSRSGCRGTLSVVIGRYTTGDGWTKDDDTGGVDPSTSWDVSVTRSSRDNGSKRDWIRPGFVFVGEKGSTPHNAWIPVDQIRPYSG